MELARRDADLVRKNAELAQKDAELERRDDDIYAQDMELEQRDMDLEQRDRELERASVEVHEALEEVRRAGEQSRTGDGTSGVLEEVMGLRGSNPNTLPPLSLGGGGWQRGSTPLTPCHLTHARGGISHRKNVELVQKLELVLRVHIPPAAGSRVAGGGECGGGVAERGRRKG